MSIVIPSIRAALLSGRNSVLVPNLLTLSGGLITDAIRLANTEGDGATTPGGIGVWEATTNLISNPNAATNVSGYAAFNGGETVTRDTIVSKFGGTSFKVVTGVGGAGVYSTPTTTNGQTYTLSGWFLGTASSSYRLLANCGSVFQQAFTGTGSWQYVTLTFVAGAITAGCCFLTGTNRNETFWFGGFQLENKPIATPYAATSRTAGRLQMPASYLNATQGWAAFRVKMGYAYTDNIAAGFPVFFAWETDSTHRIIGYYSVSLGQFVFDRINGAGTLGEAVKSKTFAINNTVTLVVAWTATQVLISVDGSTFTSAAGGGIPPLPSTFDIGSELGGLIGDSTYLAAAFGTGTATDANALTIQNLLTIGARPEAYPQSLQVTAAGPLIDSSFYKAS